MNGGVGFTGQSPCAAWISVWHSPLVSIRTRTSPPAGSGIGRSFTCKGEWKSVTTAALMVCSVQCWRERRGGLLHGLADGGGPVPTVAEELADGGVQAALVVVPLPVVRDEAVDADPAGGPPHGQDDDGEQGVPRADARSARHHVGEQQGETAQRCDPREQTGHQGYSDCE